MEPGQLLGALIAGFVLARVTVPVGVSGAVFLLPVHLWLLDVPPARVAPTTLLHNVISLPGTLLRQRRIASGTQRTSPDRRQQGLPGTSAVLSASVVGGLIGTTFRWSLAGAVDVPRFATAFALVLVGGVLVIDSMVRPDNSDALEIRSQSPRLRIVLPLALATGMVGGLSGIGGGSLLAPALVALGTLVTVAAPLALRATWFTSLSALALGVVLPDQAGLSTLPLVPVAIATGVGGLLGASWALRHPLALRERSLRRLLGVVCLSLGAAQTIATLL